LEFRDLVVVVLFGQIPGEAGVESLFFTVTAQTSFSSPPAGPGDPAPLPFTFTLADIGRANWIVDPTDGSLSLFLAFEPLRINGNAYDLAFDTLGEPNNQVDCFTAVFRPPTTAAFCSSSQEPFGRFSTGSVEFMREAH